MFFATTGAVLDVVDRAAIPDADLLTGWRMRIERAGARLGWPQSRAVARPHAHGVLLAISAPCDALMLATEINEWALCAALLASDPGRWSFLEAALRAAAADASEDPADFSPGLLPILDEAAAAMRFERLAAREARPRLRRLLTAAAAHGLTTLLDDSELTLGAGAGGQTFPLEALPDVDAVPWSKLHDIPTALVTGSNGKTTSVRLLAACARAHGWHTGYNCTDGVFIDAMSLAAGDYSGPAGTRRVMREAQAQAAVLETARGGILRRGIAVSRADVAVVTNVSADHFGEYGIDDLAGLADVKLSVTGPLLPGGLLILNADDAQLRAQAAVLVQRFGAVPRLGWFALDADHLTLAEQRLRGAPTCGVRAGRLVVQQGAGAFDLGEAAALPLALGGLAAYNVANLAGVALAALELGISAPTIAKVFAVFGAGLQDNPGRMMRFEWNGARVLLDYAHNADGLRGLLAVADGLRSGGPTGDGTRAGGRLGLLLGQAGNRADTDIRELARIVARFQPDLVVVKENESQLRGRAPGEVPRIIRNELLRLGIPESSLPVRDSEAEAARCALDWSRPGDVIALPIHSSAARASVVTMLGASQGIS